MKRLREEAILPVGVPRQTAKAFGQFPLQVSSPIFRSRSDNVTDG